MYKKSSSVGTIAFVSLKAFFENLPMFFKYLLPPILLQILAALILGVGMFFAMLQFGKNIGIFSFGVILAVFGIIILVQALWNFLIRMGGLILISKKIIENEPLRETKYYTEAFKNREGYILYLLITGCIFPLILLAIAFVLSAYTGFADLFTGSFIPKTGSLMFAILVMFLLVFLAASPFLVVTFQSFALNPRLTPLESIVKGMKLSGLKYFQSLVLIVLYTVITTIMTGLLGVFGKMVSVATGFSEDIINLIVQLLSQFLLPYTIICFTWWYLRLEKESR